MYVGIDWGGTYIKAGLVDANGKLLKKKTFTSVSLREKAVFIERVQSLVTGFGSRRVSAIGIGAPGIIEPQKGFIYYLPNVRGWKNYPLKSLLEKKLKRPVFIDNDANVFALAESLKGAGKGAKRAIFLTLGTGLGAAVIHNGMLLEGSTSASELGHMPINLKGKRCGCGGRGCIETYVGGRYLLAKYQKLTRGKKPVSGVKEIYTRALDGERAALTLWKDFSYALGMYLSGLVNAFNPERIIFGGGVAGALKLFKPLVLEVMKQQAMWPHTQRVSLVRARLKNAGIVGAALLAKRRLKHKKTA